MLVLRGIFRGSLKITSENKNNFQGKNSLKRFLGYIVLELISRMPSRTEKPFLETQITSHTFPLIFIVNNYFMQYPRTTPRRLSGSTNREPLQVIAVAIALYPRLTFSFLRGPETHLKSRNAKKKHRVYTNFSVKVCANFCRSL